MTEIRCNNCRRGYPVDGTPFRCPACGGVFDFAAPYAYDPALVEAGRPGIWRYRHSFGLPEDAPEVSLGEGDTPLEWREVAGRRVAFKLEYANPSGSYKDRGAATLVSFLRSRGVEAAVEDSSGNAGAAFAAYAAQAGLAAKVYVPDYASGPKRRQIEEYGAEIVSVPGPRSNASDAVLKAAAQGAAYASHAYLPFGLPGYATIAYELYQQMGTAPGAVIAPVGQGNLLLAIGRGFRALQQAGLIEKPPVLVGVQALACAPIWAVHRYGAAGLGWVAENETLAEGVRVKYPLRGDQLLRLVEAGGGSFVAVEEEAILPARDQLAGLGFSVEPTSAIVWSALEESLQALPDLVAVVLTGAGWKYQS